MMRHPSPIFATVLGWTVLWTCAGCETGGTRRSPAEPSARNPVSPALTLEEQVKRLAATSRPGPGHAALAALAGEWEVTLSDVSSSGTETEPFHGRATLEWILGGRFLRWEARIDFGGAPGTTTGFLGFDSRSEEYELMMISDLSQGMEVARGTGELQGAGLLFTLEQTDPRSGSQVRARSRLRLLEHEHFVLEQLESAADGTEHAARVWHYRRDAPARR